MPIPGRWKPALYGRRGCLPPQGLTATFHRARVTPPGQTHQEWLGVGKSRRCSRGQRGRPARGARAPPRVVRFTLDGIWRDGAPGCGGRGVHRRTRRRVRFPIPAQVRETPDWFVLELADGRWQDQGGIGWRWFPRIAENQPLVGRDSGVSPACSTDAPVATRWSSENFDHM